jgi:hypothetical protein
MSSTTDFNMLRLEAPREILQITAGTHSTDHVEIASPSTWLRCLVRHQTQAERDIKQLFEACGNRLDQNDQRIVTIEAAYNELMNGTRYIYEQTQNNVRVSEEWIRSELANTANAYQTFSQQVWDSIAAHTTDVDLRQIHHGTQLARLNDALAFQQEANIARNQHLAKFQGDVTTWAATQNARTATLEGELAAAKDEIRRVAASIPLPTSRPNSPVLPTFLQRAPVRTPQGPLPVTRYPVHPAGPTIGNLFPIREVQPIPGIAAEGSGGGRPPRRPRQPAVSPSPTPPPAENDNDDDLYNRPHQPDTQANLPEADLTAIARLIGEGIAAAQAVPRQPGETTDGRIGTARLKMKNPEPFDGAATTKFSRWWESVVMFLGFYPNTTDRQKIAWVGALLTETALSWHLHRYRELGDTDTWANYSAAIRTEYHDSREAADAQLKLGQLKYQGSIRAYLTEFRTLNVYARATGEGLQEKINMAMPDSILDMRFNQNEEDFVDDEHFLQATYRAGVQVEKKKALKAAKEAMKGSGSTPPGKDGKDGKEGKKDSQGSGKGSGDGRDGKDGKKGGKNETAHKETGKSTSGGKSKGTGESGNHTVWKTIKEAFQGVPQDEIDNHKKNPEGCFRCGRNGHRTTDCYAQKTIEGTALPMGKSSAVGSKTEKRKREDEPATTTHAPKQPKTAAVKAEEEVDMRDVPVWMANSDESDF